MESNKSVPLIILILAYFCYFIVPSEGQGGIVTYWGTLANQGMILADASRDTQSAVSSTVTFATCFSEAVYSQGLNVFVSVNGNNLLSSTQLLAAGINNAAAAQQVSDYVWNNYLGGHSNSRPFGDVVFDGIDFDIESSGEFWVDVARHLKQRKVYLSASVPCVFQDAPAVKAAGVFDSISVRFYNNRECEFGGANAADAFLVAWNQWTTQVNSSQIFLGLPASPAAARSGYIPPNVLTSSVLPIIKTSPRYGGVMLWDSFYDQQIRYISAIINSV